MNFCLKRNYGTDCPANYRFGECAKADVWISAWGTDNGVTLSSVDGELLKAEDWLMRTTEKYITTVPLRENLDGCGTSFPQTETLNMRE